jgi:hypothetical protein
VLAGQGYYEHTDALIAFTAVLVPLGAGAGALWAITRRPAAMAAGSRGWTIAAAVAFVALLTLLWQAFAVLTGAPRLL